MDGRFQDIINEFAKDSEKENKGVWMTYKGHQYLIARAHRDNVGFARMMEQELRPYQAFIDRNNLAAIKDVASDVMQRVYAQTILLGIRKLADKTTLDYSPDDGVMLFKRLPDFWDEVFKFAGSTEPYAPDQIEDDSKN